MSYHIAISAQQLKVIKTALEASPAIQEIDEMDNDVQKLLISMITDTLAIPEDEDVIHGFCF